MEDDLILAIQRRARLLNRREARQLLDGVLLALAHVLPQEHCETLCQCVPGDAVWCLRCGPSEPDPLVDSEVFLGWTMSSLDATGALDQTLGGEDPLAALAADEVRERVRVVLEELWARLDQMSVSAIRACLPPGLPG